MLRAGCGIHMQDVPTGVCADAGREGFHALDAVGVCRMKNSRGKQGEYKARGGTISADAVRCGLGGGGASSVGYLQAVGRSRKGGEQAVKDSD